MKRNKIEYEINKIYILEFIGIIAVGLLLIIIEKRNILYFAIGIAIIEIIVYLANERVGYFYKKLSKGEEK